MSRSALLWMLAAVAGIVLVAAVTVAASRLSTQTIGLSSEPTEAGRALAPRASGAPPSPTPDPTPSRTPTPRRTVTPQPTASADEPGDDHGGRGRGRGRGSDDD